MADDRFEIDTTLAGRLVARQFPHWAALPIERVEPGGWDNRTFHLGTEMKLRFPSAARYAAQVAKEHRWLPTLAEHLPVPIPSPLAKGEPGDGYPWPWSVQRWLPGEVASASHIPDRAGFAVELAQFLRALQAIPAAGGPAAGAQSFFRGGALGTYDAETRRCLRALAGSVDAEGAASAWEAALASRWQRPPVWVHGDIAAGNLLVEDGRLAAVIDFGSCAVGDPACDLVIAWTFLDGDSRAAFRAAVAADPGTWARARGWALWKALLVLADGTEADVAGTRRLIADVIAEHRSAFP